MIPSINALRRVTILLVDAENQHATQKRLTKALGFDKASHEHALAENDCWQVKEMMIQMIESRTEKPKNSKK